MIDTVFIVGSCEVRVLVKRGGVWVSLTFSAGGQLVFTGRQNFLN